MAFFHQKIVDAFRAALDALRRDRFADFHAELLDDFFVGVLGAVGELNGLDLGARARLHVDDDVHLVRVVMRDGFDLDFGLVQTFVVERVGEARDAFVDGFFSVWIAERERHRGGGGCVGGRRVNAADDHLIEEELFAHDEVDA